MGARPAVLVIAGTDSSGGAGLARDLRTLAHFEVDAVCAVTAVTAQSNSHVQGVQHVAPEIVRAQITGSRDVAAVKIGMLGNRATVHAVVESLVGRIEAPLVLDPVLVSSSGGVLLDAEGQEAMRCELFPHVTLLTPNLLEAAALLNEPLAQEESAIVDQALRLLALGPRAVLLKGGHASGVESSDYLAVAGQPVLQLAGPRLAGTMRGTGCALSSAIAAGLACQYSLVDACKVAKDYVANLIKVALQVSRQASPLRGTSGIVRG